MGMLPHVGIDHIHIGAADAHEHGCGLEVSVLLIAHNIFNTCPGRDIGISGAVDDYFRFNNG